MRAFLDKIQPQDRVRVIGDIRQHQDVEAGCPLEQMQDAGMRTSYLDQIMRQKDPELLKAVQHLAPGKTVEGIRLLSKQGQLTCSSNGWPSATMTPNARRIPQLKLRIAMEKVIGNTFSQPRSTAEHGRPQEALPRVAMSWAAHRTPISVVDVTIEVATNRIYSRFHPPGID